MIIHYRQLYIDRPEPIAFMRVAVDTLGRIYDDFLRLLFLDAHREASVLANDIPEESGHFRFLRAPCLDLFVLLPLKISVVQSNRPCDLKNSEHA